MKRLILAVMVFWSAAAFAAEPPSGTLRLRMESWPKSLNNYTSNDLVGATLWGMVHISMTDKDLDTWEDTPFLAEKWELGKDKRTYTFHLNPKAVWADGSPITADDVKWSLDLIYDIKRCVLCEGLRSWTGPMEEVKVVDPHTVVVKMKLVHYQNLSKIGSLTIFQKKVYEGKDFNNDFDKELVGGGAPYVFDKDNYKMRKEVVFKRVYPHWTDSLPQAGDRNHFETVRFKYIEDNNVAFESFKRKEIDFFYFEATTIQFWNNQKGEPWTNPALKKINAPRFNPFQWGGIALNMRKGVLSDLRFRKALQYLFNRDLIVTKLFQGHQKPLGGPFMPGTKNSNDFKPVPFDPKMAAKLLKEAGFEKTDSDGVLYREITQNGQKTKERASIRVIYATDAHSQWITILKEDAKKSGVEIIPRLMDWTAASKLLDDFSFEGFVIGWGGNPDPEPEQLWGGASADTKSSSNLPGFKDPSADKLMPLAAAEFNADKRGKIYREIEKKIVDAQPYVWRWIDKEHLVAYWTDVLDPGPRPYRKFSGTDMRSPFWVTWKALKK